MHEIQLSTPVDIQVTDASDLDMPDLKGASGPGGGSNSGGA
jgi:hypothetical protein